MALGDAGIQRRAVGRLAGQRQRVAVPRQRHVGHPEIEVEIAGLAQLPHLFREKGRRFFHGFHRRVPFAPAGEQLRHRQVNFGQADRVANQERGAAVMFNGLFGVAVGVQHFGAEEIVQPLPARVGALAAGDEINVFARVAAIVIHPAALPEAFGKGGQRGGDAGRGRVDFARAENVLFARVEHAVAKQHHPDLAQLPGLVRQRLGGAQGVGDRPVDVAASRIDVRQLHVDFGKAVAIGHLPGRAAVLIVRFVEVGPRHGQLALVIIGHGPERRVDGLEHGIDFGDIEGGVFEILFLIAHFLVDVGEGGV